MLLDFWYSNALVIVFKPMNCITQFAVNCLSQRRHRYGAFWMVLLTCFVNGKITAFPEFSWRQALQGDNLVKVIPWILIFGGSYELCVELKDLYQRSAASKRDDDSSHRLLCELYRKKEKFLDDMASMQSSDSRKKYFEILQKKSERGLEEAKKGIEIAKKKEQRINEERKKLADEQLELDKQIGKLRRELEAKFGKIV